MTDWPGPSQKHQGTSSDLICNDTQTQCNQYDISTRPTVDNETQTKKTCKAKITQTVSIVTVDKNVQVKNHKHAGMVTDKIMTSDRFISINDNMKNKCL